MRTYLDIETVPYGDCPPAPEEWINAVGNATKPETVRAKQAANEAAWPEEWRKRASLDWRMGQIVCVVVHQGSGPALRYSGATLSERAILQMVWTDLVPSAPIVGFGIRRFDWPFLLGRSAVLGVTPSRHITESPYAHQQMIDWADVLSSHNTFTSKGWNLARYASLFDLPAPIGDGSEVYDHYLAGEWDAIVDHCASDVATVVALDAKCRGVYLPERSA